MSGVDAILELRKDEYREAEKRDFTSMFQNSVGPSTNPPPFNYPTTYFDGSATVK
jgi:hypothetical protein